MIHADLYAFHQLMFCCRINLSFCISRNENQTFRVSIQIDGDGEMVICLRYLLVEELGCMN